MVQANPGNGSAPAAGTARGAMDATGQRLLANHTAGSPLGLLLTRFERVQRHGKGYRADCPRGHRSRGTLSLSESDTGAVLMHCFSGCSPADVLAALGLDLAALFPERLAPTTPEQRRQSQQWAREARWAAALPALALESMVVVVAARQTLAGDPLSAEDMQRLIVASERIDDSRAVLNAR